MQHWTAECKELHHTGQHQGWEVIGLLTNLAANTPSRLQSCPITMSLASSNARSTAKTVLVVPVCLATVGYGIEMYVYSRLCLLVRILIQQQSDRPNMHILAFVNGYSKCRVSSNSAVVPATASRVSPSMTPST